ncbi:Nicotinate phosphoribosyltransferase [Planctomycetales bacterium 10988]|nr:Nicotinate phosphoribosyltransferase [Planctomycetales bacterium 10988]
MSILSQLYHSSQKQSLSLLTDFYQITMAYAYWKQQRQQQEVVFHLFFRTCPFQGGYVLACGMEEVIEYITNWEFLPEDLGYLRSLRGNNGAALFEEDFLKDLGKVRFTGQLAMVPEGTPIFPNEPILRIQGPLWQCQLLETPLLNMVNFQSLIATKAARICQAAEGDAVIDFGLRRAQGFDGGLSASRAAFIGGCQGTSNVLAGKFLDIPVKGTHAHSWIMSFEDELEAFRNYAEAMPQQSLFLVDTYDTIEGVRKAIRVGQELSEKGHELMGIRLDSGDLVELSKESRKLLDEAGFPEAKILASNDLDEYRIQGIKQAGGKIDLWGVGTRLVTAYDQPALGGVYKLGSIRKGEHDWHDCLKLSADSIKSTNPGMQQVRRFVENGQFQKDVLYDIRDEETWPESSFDLLQPVLQDGAQVYQSSSIREVQEYAREQLGQLPQDVKAFKVENDYPVELSSSLLERKRKLTEALLAKSP